mgnify:CR=1 FL=1
MPLKLGKAARATARVFDRVRPDVVVGFGGYVSVPAYLVARRHVDLGRTRSMMCWPF